MGRAPLSPLGRTQLKRWPPVQRPGGVAKVAMIADGDVFKPCKFFSFKRCIVSMVKCIYPNKEKKKIKSLYTYILQPYNIRRITALLDLKQTNINSLRPHVFDAAPFEHMERDKWGIWDHLNRSKKLERYPNIAKLG